MTKNLQSFIMRLVDLKSILKGGLMTNTLEFKSLIVKNGLTQKKLAKMLGVSFATLNMKINNKREFKSKEISKLCQILNIQNVNLIFFV